VVNYGETRFIGDFSESRYARFVITSSFLVTVVRLASCYQIQFSVSVLVLLSCILLCVLVYFRGVINFVCI
jgi:hypothetical protein